MLTKLRFISAGESHGPYVTGILDGFPAGIQIEHGFIETQLQRRQLGFGRSARMKLELDKVIFTGGVVAGKTTGAPICFMVENQDHINWKHRPIAPMQVPRPGHADLVGAVKFQHADLRLSLERASARETVIRVVAGALAQLLLKHLGINLGGYVGQIGEMILPQMSADFCLQQALDEAKKSQFAFGDSTQDEALHAYIHGVMKEKDTVGGQLTLVAQNMPVGLGSYTQWDKRLDGQIAMAMLSVPAMKAVAIGDALSQASWQGTKAQDAIVCTDGDKLMRQTNHNGGLEGGVSNGEPLIVHVWMKPISTTLTPQTSVNLVTHQQQSTQYERSDFCAVPRALVVIESMLALVVANALLEKLGGDSIAEIEPRFASLKQARFKQLTISDQPLFWETSL